MVLEFTQQGIILIQARLVYAFCRRIVKVFKGITIEHSVESDGIEGTKEPHGTVV